MTTRKKATKKSLSRPSKAAKRPSKSSPSAKAKDAKIAKPARPAKKTAAKSAKSARVASRAVARARTKAERSKSSRAASARSSAKASAKRKAAVSAKTQATARASNAAARTAASHAKARKIVSAAKKKAESVKKGHDHLAAALEARDAPAVAVSEASPRELPKAVAAPAGTENVAPAKAATKPAGPEKPAAASAEEATGGKGAKSAGQRQGFKTGEFIVYPAHGVGQIVAVEEQEVAGFRLELFVITFVKDKMTLRVPTGKVGGVGMRKLAEPEVVKKALDILLGRARIKRTMWSRRAQEYEAKINSGDLTAIAEVVRDLYRSEAQPEQSYSERQLYEAALDRLAREVAVVQKLSEGEALKAIEAQLQKGQRRGPKVEAEAAVAGVSEPDVEEAA